MLKRSPKFCTWSYTALNPKNPKNSAVGAVCRLNGLKIRASGFGLELEVKGFSLEFLFRVYGSGFGCQGFSALPVKENRNCNS